VTDADKTAELYRITRTPAPIAADAEEEEAASLLANLIEHTDWVIRLMAGRADAIVRAQLQDALRKAIAAAQQLDGHLAEADRAGHDAVTEATFQDWLTGGER